MYLFESWALFEIFKIIYGHWLSFYSASLDKLDFSTSMCGKLLEVCLKTLFFRYDIKIICMLIKLVLTSIQRQQQEMVRRQDGTHRQAKEGEIMSGLLKILGSKLTHDLQSTMSNFYKDEKLLEELEVSTSVNVNIQSNMQLPKGTNKQASK